MLGQYGLLFNTLLAVLIAALICNAVSVPVRGVGIAMPSIVPPLVAVLLGWLLGDGNPTLVAYVSGTLGALLGADIMNWKKLKHLDAPMVSIGGAGTFDGVFLAELLPSSWYDGEFIRGKFDRNSAKEVVGCFFWAAVESTSRMSSGMQVRRFLRLR